jgi:chemotaxis protein methyltransferase CheR
VPEWRAAQPTGPLRIWSAACSSGEEPYTIAMTLADLPSPIQFGIFASDMSTKVLATAKSGVYKMSGVESLPRDVLHRHFERGMGAQEGTARVAASIRRHVSFQNLNLLEIGDLGERFDVIFCRNVMIYFDKNVQQRVVSMLERHLKPTGYLFISHSESLNGITHSMRWVAPAVYTRRR